MPKKHLSFHALRTQLSSIFDGIEDSRASSKKRHSLHDFFMSAFACMYFQDPSLLHFQKKLEESHHRNNLRSLFNVQSIPKDTQMREVIDQVEGEALRPAFKGLFNVLQRGKHLKQYEALEDAYYLAIDGTQYYSSEEVSCDHCLIKKHGKDKDKESYSHQVLQGGIMHPDKRQVIPLMPEEISNTDGTTKQDCEINAAKRLIVKIRKDHPQLGVIIGGDGLYSKQPFIEALTENRMHYLLVAKPKDHQYLMEWVSAYDSLDSLHFTDEKGREHVYEWKNSVPLSGRKDAVSVNFFRCTVTSTNRKGKTRSYTNSWVTDLNITPNNIKFLVRLGRCRWKAENEVFNTLKNQGYYINHSYGHGKKNLSYQFYLLTLLAFFFHQIFELTDELYQRSRERFGSKKHLWETLRTYLKILIFTTWETLLEFALAPKKHSFVGTTLGP